MNELWEISVARIFISYTAREPDQTLGIAFYKALKSCHHVFFAQDELRWGQNWEERIIEELETCDYFLVLLSKHAIVSQMVAGEVRKARNRFQKEGKPAILPLRMNLPFDFAGDYELNSYLHRIQQRTWSSPEDTKGAIDALLELVNAGKVPDLLPETDDAVPKVMAPDTKSCRPLPAVPPSSQVVFTSPFYVERSVDQMAMDCLLEDYTLIRIKAPRQYGKTSLLSRLIHHAEANHYHVVSWNLQRVDTRVFEDLRLFLGQFCAHTARCLKNDARVQDHIYDDSFISLKELCTDFFLECILADLDKPLLITLDEADLIFEHEAVFRDFFGLLRSWHEGSKTDALLAKLKLIIVYSTEPYISMDVNQSPFENVGCDAELKAFTQTEILSLARKYGLPWEREEVDRLMAMIGGHPYLVRVSLYEIASGHFNPDELLAAAPLETGPFSDHLRRHSFYLKDEPELAKTMKLVLDHKPCTDESAFYRLKAVGLVDGEFPRGRLSLNIYRQFLEKRL